MTKLLLPLLMVMLSGCGQVYSVKRIDLAMQPITPYYECRGAYEKAVKICTTAAECNDFCAKLNQPEAK